MDRSQRYFILLLAAALALALVGCYGEKPLEPGPEAGKQEQVDLARPSPGDPEYCACILIPDFWGEAVILEGNREMGYIMAGFNVPAGTSLYAPFDGVTRDVSLEDYSSEKSGSFEGISLCAPDSLNGFAAYNITGTAAGSVKAGEVFAEVSSDQHIFPKHYGKVNLILEFNLFDSEADGYNEMQDLFGKIFDHLLDGS